MKFSLIPLVAAFMVGLTSAAPIKLSLSSVTKSLYKTRVKLIFKVDVDKLGFFSTNDPTIKKPDWVTREAIVKAINSNKKLKPLNCNVETAIMSLNCPGFFFSVQKQEMREIVVECTKKDGCTAKSK